MGTVAEKLEYLQETKTAIRTAIEGKGQTVADSDTFRSYADKIGAISTSDSAAPTVTITSAGKVTATSSGGTTTKTLSSTYDSDFEAANIKSGVTIFGVKGTYSQTPVKESCTWSWSPSSMRLTITTSQNVGTVCGFQATMYNSSCNIVIVYSPSDNKGMAFYAVTSSQMTATDGSVSFSGTKIYVTLSATGTTIGQSYSDGACSVSYIPA